MTGRSTGLTRRQPDLLADTLEISAPDRDADGAALLRIARLVHDPGKNVNLHTGGLASFEGRKSTP